ncbi:MAG: class I SAM-dependent methyltransferase [Clostridia bacterium]|nr:class I SAM-dependent methyltransferase [Clostridia bacterium]
MKKTDTFVKLIESEIKNKDVLEVACGGAEFSVSASRLAHCVHCIDLDASRLGDLNLPDNVHFSIMDASKMSFHDWQFDTVVLYNAFFHVQTEWDIIKEECKRVLKSGGCLIIVGTWSLDMAPMKDVFGEQAKLENDYLIVKEKKSCF